MNNPVDYWLQAILKLAPKANRVVAQGVAEHLGKVFQHYNVLTPLRKAHFLAQAAHETDGFKTLREYASGAAYEGRTNLGNIFNGDGKKYRGRGIFQTTGRSNYTQVRKLLNALGFDVDPVKNPAILEQPELATWSAGIYWDTRKLNAHADADDVRQITRIINGGYNGIKDREYYLAKAKVVFGVPTDAVVTAPLDRTTVRNAQTRLLDLGYVMVGKADGIVGAMTTGAIAAFQHDNDIPISGVIDPKTLARLMMAEKRPIPPSRSQGVPEESRIIDVAATIGKVSGVVGAVGVVELLDQARLITGYYEQAKAIILPYMDQWPALLVAGGAFFGYEAWKIYKARVEDYQTGKTS